MQIAKFAEVEWETRAESSVPGGPMTNYKVLHRANSPVFGEMEMTVKRYPQPSFMDRHRHKFDQIRYVLQGAEPWAAEHSTPAGSVLYTASGTFYGPYDRDPDVELLSVKFPGADFEPGAARAANDAARQRVPLARFASPVELHPDNFVWRTSGDGAQHKDFGTFTEVGTSLGGLALDAGGAHRCAVGRTTLLFVTAGSGTIGGESLTECDAVMVEPGESIELGATQRFELFVIGLPTRPTATSF